MCLALSGGAFELNGSEPPDGARDSVLHDLQAPEKDFAPGLGSD